jgi:hypothetical protein
MPVLSTAPSVEAAAFHVVPSVPSHPVMRSTCQQPCSLPVRFTVKLPVSVPAATIFAPSNDDANEPSAVAIVTHDPVLMLEMVGEPSVPIRMMMRSPAAMPDGNVRVQAVAFVVRVPLACEAITGNAIRRTPSRDRCSSSLD